MITIHVNLPFSTTFPGVLVTKKKKYSHVTSMELHSMFHILGVLSITNTHTYTHKHTYTLYYTYIYRSYANHTCTCYSVPSKPTSTDTCVVLHGVNTICIWTAVMRAQSTFINIYRRVSRS